LYVPSLVTWWRLRSLVLLSALSTLSLSLSSVLPKSISCSTIAGLSRECSLPRSLLSYPFFFHHSFSVSPPSLPLFFFFFFCVRSNAIHRRRAREASLTLLLDFHSVDRSFAHNGYRVTRSWRSPCLTFFFFSYLRNLLLLLVSSRWPPRRAPLCPLHRLLIRSMIKFTVVNGSGSGTKIGGLTAVRFFRMT